MRRRPTWPEVLSLFEEPRFQLAVVTLVVAVGSVVVATTLPRPGAPSWSPAPAPRAVESTSTATPATPTATRTVTATASTTAQAATPAAASPSVTPSVSSILADFAAGDRAQLVVAAPVRLDCSDDQRPLGVMLSGRHVEVIEVGVSTCAGWLLVQSEGALTWLLPSVLEPAEVAAADGRASPTR